MRLSIKDVIRPLNLVGAVSVIVTESEITLVLNLLIFSKSVNDRVCVVTVLFFERMGLISSTKESICKIGLNLVVALI